MTFDVKAKKIQLEWGKYRYSPTGRLAYQGIFAIEKHSSSFRKKGL
jgi:hypothetical protein